MNDACRLRCLRADRNRPSTRLGLAAGEVTLEPQQAIRLAHQARQAAFLKAHGLQVLLGFLRVKLSQVCLDLRRNGHRRAAVDLGKVGVKLVFIDVGDVEHGLHRQQVKLVDGVNLVLGKIQRACAMSFVEALKHLLGSGKLGSARLVTLGLLLKTRNRFLDGSHVGKDQLGLDGLHVALRVDLAGNVHNVGVAEEAHDFADGVGFANVRQKLVAQALALRRASNQAGDIDELNRGGHDARRVVDLRKRVQAGIGNRDHAHVGLDGGERVVCSKATLIGKSGEQRGLAHVGHAHDTDGKRHGNILFVQGKP